MKCPHCGSHNTEVDEFEPHFDDEYAIVPFYCHSCGTTWNSVYKFDCNEEVDVLRKEEAWLDSNAPTAEQTLASA